MLVPRPLDRNAVVAAVRDRRLVLRAAFAPTAAARTAFGEWRAAGPPSLRDVSPSGRSLVPLLSARIGSLTESREDRCAALEAFREAWARNLGLVTAAGPAVEALGAAGIPVVLLKGAALAFGAYASPGLRPMSDVDLLVPARAAAGARRVVEEAGYVPVERHGEGFLDSVHGIAFRGPDGLEVDLHWHALLERPSEAADGLFFEDAAPLSLPGLAALAPTPESHLLLVAIHAWRWSVVPHFVGFADAVVLLGRSRPGRLVEMAAAARGLGLLAALARTLSVVEAALPGTVPAPLAEAIDRETPSLADRFESALRRRPPGLLPGLALHWLAHRGAAPGSTPGECLRTFPARMRHVWGLGPGGSVTAEAVRRASSRIASGRGVA